MFLADVDECRNPALYSCPTNNSVCVNEEGSYRCGCAKGYKKLRSREFRDQDIDCIGEFKIQMRKQDFQRMK